MAAGAERAALNAVAMSWFYTAPLLLLAPLVLLLVLGSLEPGHRLGRALPIPAQQVATVSAPIVEIRAASARTWQPAAAL